MTPLGEAVEKELVAAYDRVAKLLESYPDEAIAALLDDFGSHRQADNDEAFRFGAAVRVRARRELRRRGGEIAFIGRPG